VRISEISDTVKVGTVVVAIIAGAVSTTWAVKANTVAVNQLTASLKEISGKVDSLERWKISSEAYAQGVKDAHNDASRAAAEATEGEAQ
jgi:outer membrane murein-binding lipoprotein Lpp